MSSLSLKKNWSSMLLPFISGVILTALVFSFSGSASTQESAGDFQGDLRNPTIQPAPGFACSTTNCQLMTKLNQMHGNGGNSTWNLNNLALQTAARIDARANDIRGNSSWTLQALASQIWNTCQN